MRNKINNITSIAIFSSIIIVLQLLATYINFGSFPITLTLIPIIVSSAIYGERFGALMGLVFGSVVSAMVITGADTSGATMFASHPIITVLTCLVKGTLAGFFSGLVYKKINNKKIAIIVSAIVAPISNTFLLLLSLVLFFDSNFTILVTGLMTINFAIELITNILIAPGLTGLINRQTNRKIN